MKYIFGVPLMALMFAAWASVTAPARHCDTLDGPVAKAGVQALEKGDLTPALRWVHDEQEKELVESFKTTLAVRSKGPEVRQLVDQYFLETLVRLHRESEGQPYTGLKPAGTDLGPAIAGADGALNDGSVDGLVKLLTDEVAAGLRRRFAEAAERKKHANESITAGREFVAAYVEFVHYVERLDMDARGEAEQGAAPGHAPPEH
jgi:hypothetical protein